MTNQAIPAWAAPGAKVVCVDDSPVDSANGYGDEAAPTKDVVYTIERVRTSPEGHVGLQLSEIVNPVHKYRWYEGQLCYLISRFRPAVEPKSLEEDTALFKNIVRGMSLVERLDRIKESLDV